MIEHVHVMIRSVTFSTVVALLLCGCGSKVSEANYYKVHHGMTEEAVEDLLGPHHAEEPQPAMAAATASTTRETAPATPPSSTEVVQRKVKTWSRGRLSMRVVFVDGRVVARSAVGIPFEKNAG